MRWMNSIQEAAALILQDLSKAVEDPGVLSEGRTHLQRAQELARHPRYGLCWMGALGQLDAGCKELDEERQSRIALAFAHCHLGILNAGKPAKVQECTRGHSAGGGMGKGRAEAHRDSAHGFLNGQKNRSGKKFPPCGPASSVRDCTQDMDPVAFGVYTEFFTHAQSICYFLQNEAWQERAQDTVLRLTSASEDVARQLESTHELAEETARTQNATLRSQEQILRDGELLRQTLQDSSQGVRQAFQDLQDSAVEQRVVFAEIFNHVAFLHRFVVGKSNAVYSILFHLLSVVAVLALTSSQRTSGARFILLALVGASVYLESVICSLLVDNTGGGPDPTESLSFWVGLCRWGLAALGFAVVAYFLWSYKDPVRQSREVLESLRETQVEFRHLLQETERLLAERHLLLHGSGLQAKNEVSFDSGVLEQLSSSECGAEELEVPSERHQVAEVRASTPKRRGRSPSRTVRSASRQRGQTWSVSAQPLTIPVPLEGALQRSLRSRRRPATPCPPNHL